MTKQKESITTAIWREIPETDNPFAASASFCHGYNVYGDALGKAGWIEFLYLLFNGDRPTQPESRLLENLSVALANPGPRDHSVMAAMNGGAGGSGSAACLMAALAAGAGLTGGAREVSVAMQLWIKCGTSLEEWRKNIVMPDKKERADVWPSIEHPPGFDPYGVTCTMPVKQVLELLAKESPGSALPWLYMNRIDMEHIAQRPLSMAGVAAAAFQDLRLDPDQGEMLYLILRLPGAAVHALEQKRLGYRNFPFFRNSIHLMNDPKSSMPPDTEAG